MNKIYVHPSFMDMVNYYAWFGEGNILVLIPLRKFLSPTGQKKLPKVR